MKLSRGGLEFLALMLLGGHLPRPSDAAACSGPSRCGLDKPESVLMAECRPALTAPARRRVKSAVGAAESLRRGRTKARKQKNACRGCVPLAQNSGRLSNRSSCGPG